MRKHRTWVSPAAIPLYDTEIPPSFAPFRRQDQGRSVVCTIMSFFSPKRLIHKDLKEPFCFDFPTTSLEKVWRGFLPHLLGLVIRSEGCISQVWVRAVSGVQPNPLIKTSSVGAESPAPVESKLPLFPWAQPQGLLPSELSLRGVSRTCLAKSPKFSRHLVNGVDLTKLEQIIVPFLFPVETSRRWIWEGFDTQPWEKLQNSESQRTNCHKKELAA